MIGRSRYVRENAEVAAKYQVVLGELSRQIDTMEAGDQLPTEETLAERFSVSAMTVRRALQALADAKRTVAVRGRGTFVAPRTVSKRMTLTSFTESMKAAGMQAHTELISASISPADKNAADRLRVEIGEPVYQLNRLRFGDNIPLCLELTFLPARLYPGLLGEDLTGSLYELLHRRYGVMLQRAESRITAVSPAPDQADLLHVSAGQPCISIRATTMAEDYPDVVMESSDSLYRGDRYELLVETEPLSAGRE
jgi:GntR family transcriptional regulator